LANQLIRQKEEDETLLSGTSVSIADEISKLNDLHIKGVLTADEFSKAKEKLISNYKAS
jgi:hypothetical protein